MTDVAGRTPPRSSHPSSHRSSHRREPEGGHGHVTAVLVSHDGAAWLPQVLTALGTLTRMPDAWVVVDTGSTDDSARILAEAFGADDVLSLPATTPYADAVAEGLSRRPPPPDGWIWLLHDDSAPAPEALESLVREATTAPDVAVVGPKVREWPSLRRLVEVGVTLGGTGRRETGLEPGEPDQGQHDAARDVLAVGTAGMLVRADVWRELGGLDAALGLGEDLDLGWRVNRAGHRVRVAPDALVFHVEAATRGRRSDGTVSGRPRRERRRAALLVLLANCRRTVLPVQLVRLFLGSLLRALGLLLVKAPGEAWDELRAVASVYARPLRLFRLRRARRRTARVPPSAVRRLLPSAWHPYRAGAASVAEVVTGLLGARSTTVPRARVAETGPVAEEAESLAPEPGPLDRLAAHPWAGTVLLLAVLTLVVLRDLLGGAGQLQGGALLPAPAGGSQWWAGYLASWHPAGVGTSADAPAYALLLAVLGVVTLGHAGLLVSLLLLLSAPLAALTGYVLARRLGLATPSRIWAAAVYGCTPLLTGALAQGRLGTVLATVWLPLVVAAVVDLARWRRDTDTRLVLWTRRARAGLALGVLVALVPVAYPLALLIGLGPLLVALRPATPVRPGGAVVSFLVVLAMPWAVAPWWLLERFREPAAWWWEAGLADAGVGLLQPTTAELALGQPGGPGGVVTPWLLAGVVVGAVLALARSDVRHVVLPAWCVAAAGLAVAAAGSGRVVTLDPGQAPVWVGFCLVVWWGGMLVAAAAGAADLRARLAGRSFGLSQPLVALVAIAAAVGPVLALSVQVSDGLDGPLRRDAPQVVPSYMAEDAISGAHVATVVLAGAAADGLGVTVVRADGWRTGEEPFEAAAGYQVVTAALTDLLVSPRTDSAVNLARQGIGYLYAPAPVDPDVAAALDTAPGLVRAGAPEGDRAWQLDVPTGQLLAVSGDDAAGEPLDLESAADGSPPWTVVLPAADESRRLVVAAGPNPDWSALVDGARVAADTAVDGSGGVPTFEVDAGDDVRVVVEHDSWRGWKVAAQSAVLVILLVLAAPTRRRRS